MSWGGDDEGGKAGLAAEPSWGTDDASYKRSEGMKRERFSYRCLRRLTFSDLSPSSAQQWHPLFSRKLQLDNTI